jgi:hypothetical protein
MEIKNPALSIGERLIAEKTPAVFDSRADGYPNASVMTSIIVAVGG